MYNFIRITGFLLFTILIGVCQAQPVVLTEEMMQSLASKSSPRLDEIEASFLAVELGEKQLKERYAPELFGQYAHAETRERALVRFQPVFSPIDQAQLGVRRTTSHGIGASAAVVTDQRSAAPTAFTGRFKQATTTTLNFTVQIDLWRDLLGRMSKAEIESLELERKRAELERKISEKTYKLSLRRIYWSLVANQEFLKISQELQSTAETLAKETRSRQRNAVAEADEVARYDALVAQRQGSVSYYHFQRENLLRQLQTLVPELAGKDISLGNYDIPGAISQVLACTASIASETGVPYKNTDYDDIVAMVRKIRKSQDTVNSRYADMDVKLFGTAKSTGVSAEPQRANGTRGSIGGSIDDQTEQNRTGYEVGVMFSLPLGDAKEDTKKVKELYDQKRLDAVIGRQEAELEVTHQSFARSISHLNEVVKASRVNSENLQRRLRLIRRKYEQARVSVNDLVQDQDAYLSSELTTIDVRLQIVNQLFDYLVVFPETPCAFNRI